MILLFNFVLILRGEGEGKITQNSHHRPHYASIELASLSGLLTSLQSDTEVLSSRIITFISSKFLQRPAWLDGWLAGSSLNDLISPVPASITEQCWTLWSTKWGWWSVNTNTSTTSTTSINPSAQHYQSISTAHHSDGLILYKSQQEVVYHGGGFQIWTEYDRWTTQLLMIFNIISWAIYVKKDKLYQILSTNFNLAIVARIELNSCGPLLTLLYFPPNQKFV